MNWIFLIDSIIQGLARVDKGWQGLGRDNNDAAKDLGEEELFSKQKILIKSSDCS